MKEMMVMMRDILPTNDIFHGRCSDESCLCQAASRSAPGHRREDG